MLELEARSGGEAGRAGAPAPTRRCARTRLEVWRADGSLLYADAGAGPHTACGPPPQHARTSRHAPDALPGGRLRRATRWTSRADAAMGALGLGAGAVTLAPARWWRRRALARAAPAAPAARPGGADARHLAAQPAPAAVAGRPGRGTAALDRPVQCADGTAGAAYAQLEGFNADVAHELRTPLATLIGETEVALSRERSGRALRDTLASNLEEMQRLSAMVNDMLFLSQADRGAVARRGEPVSLARWRARWPSSTRPRWKTPACKLRVVGDATWRWTSRWSSARCPTCWAMPRALPSRGSTVVVEDRRRGRPAEQVRWWCRTAARADRAAAAAAPVRPLLPRRRVALLRGHASSTTAWAWPSWRPSRACMPGARWRSPRPDDRGALPAAQRGT
jgi:signal transduction histidine kinase